MKLLLTLFVGILISFSCYAQYSISGIVQSETSGEAVSNANVLIVDSGLASVTDNQGQFMISNLPAGVLTIKISHVGYAGYSQQINLSENLTMSFSLIESIVLSDEVVIRSLRASEETPMTFSEVKKDELQINNFGRDIPFLLEQQPSVVSTSDAGAGIGYTGIRIRGSDQTRINVTINGVPLNDAEGQGVFWVNLPDLASSTQSIQVQRGVGTSTNGPGAFGGSININTLGSNVEPYTEFVGTWGSFNTRRYALNAGTGIINNRFSVDARVSKIDSDGYVDRATSDLISLYTSLSYFGKSSKLSFNILSGREKTYQAWYGVPQSRIENDLEGMMEHIANNGLNDQQAENLLTSGRTYNFYEYENEIDDYGQDHYQLLFTQDIGDRLVFNSTLFYTHGEGFFEQFKEDEDYDANGLDSPIIGSDTITSTDLIRRRWLDNDLLWI